MIDFAYAMAPVAGRRRLRRRDDAGAVLCGDLRHLLFPAHPSPAAPAARAGGDARRGQEGRSGGHDGWRARHRGGAERGHDDAEGGGSGEDGLRSGRHWAHRARARATRSPAPDAPEALASHRPRGGRHRRLAVVLYPPEKTINLGLDLQGGIHLVLGVDMDKAIGSQVARSGGHHQGGAGEEGHRRPKVERRARERASSSSSPPRSSWKDAQAVCDRHRAPSTCKEADPAAGRVVLALKPGEVRQLRELAVRQVLETIRNRVDQFGVAEPSIQQQGENRILVQLPGVQDPERAKALIGKTALLEFKLVDDKVDPEAARAGGRPLPAEIELLYQRRVDKETKQERKIPFVVQKKALPHRQRPHHRARLHRPEHERALRVGRVQRGRGPRPSGTSPRPTSGGASPSSSTAMSIPRRRSASASRPGAPRSPAGSPPRRRRDLAIVLRAGALPAPVQILEERTVGPSLGADSIRQGLISTAAAALGVVLFMWSTTGCPG